MLSSPPDWGAAVIRSRRRRWKPKGTPSKGAVGGGWCYRYRLATSQLPIVASPAAVSSTRRAEVENEKEKKKKKWIFRVMSIIISASCLSSGSNQEPTGAAAAPAYTSRRPSI